MNSFHRVECVLTYLVLGLVPALVQGLAPEDAVAAAPGSAHTAAAIRAQTARALAGSPAHAASPPAAGPTAGRAHVLDLNKVKWYLY